MDLPLVKRASVTLAPSSSRLLGMWTAAARLLAQCRLASVQTGAGQAPGRVRLHEVLAEPWCKQAGHTWCDACRAQ